MEDADLKLIRKSAKKLKQLADMNPKYKFVIVPRPGCGNGRLQWEQVRHIMENLPDNVFCICK